MRHFRQTYGFYAVFLKEIKCGDMIYGRHYYTTIRRERSSVWRPGR